MSYCVNCGVELGEGATCCPLCGTEVINPRVPQPENCRSYYPTRKEQIPEVSKKGYALVISSMLGSVALCCGLLNLALHPDYPWSLYAVGTALMLWIFFVPSLLWRKMPFLLRVFVNTCATGLYVFLIALASHGLDWYVRLALPILLGAGAIGILICWIVRNHSRLTSLIFTLVGIGIFCIEVEFFTDRFLHAAWNPVWSLIVAAVTIGLAVPFIVIRLKPSLREQTRRIFHL